MSNLVAQFFENEFSVDSSNNFLQIKTLGKEFVEEIETILPFIETDIETIVFPDMKKIIFLLAEDAVITAVSPTLAPMIIAPAVISVVDTTISGLASLI